MNRCADRVVPITGAGRGIGRATAERLASEGAALALLDRDETAANQAAAALRETGANALARGDGEQMIIEGHRGRTLAPSTVVSNHPWNHAVLDRPLLFDTQRGKLQQVRVTPAGEDTIRVGALKYVVTGDLERELWYGRDGAWLQSRLEYQGAEITLTRQ